MIFFKEGFENEKIDFFFNEWSSLKHSFVLFVTFSFIFIFCLFALVRSSALTLDALKTDEDPKEIDFFTKQARLQIEARMALAQAKDIAHMQMEVSEKNFSSIFSRF